MSASVEEYSKPIFINGKYENPFPTWKQPGFFNLCKYFLCDTDESGINSEEELNSKLPVIKPNFDDFIPTSSENSELRVAWLGHSSLLVQFDGITILTDPIFSQRCSPFQFIGPKRFRDAPCQVSDLPPIDIVLISHNHYDHMDYQSIVDLEKRYGSRLTWFVPIGDKAWMKDSGCANVVEMTWWQEEIVTDCVGVKVVCVPCQHWSSRKAYLGVNQSLWSSWCVIGPTERFYFAGDTGYCEAFRQIGRRYGPFSLAGIPIGAYKPRWFKKAQHVAPDESVQIHLDVRSKKSIGIHWGTFRLTHEHYLEPRTKLKEEMEKKNLSPEDFFTLNHGEIRVISNGQKLTKLASLEKINT